MFCSCAYARAITTVASSTLARTLRAKRKLIDVEKRQFPTSVHRLLICLFSSFFRTSYNVRGGNVFARAFLQNCGRNRLVKTRPVLSDAACSRIPSRTVHVPADRPVIPPETVFIRSKSFAAPAREKSTLPPWKPRVVGKVFDDVFFDEFPP